MKVIATTKIQRQYYNAEQEYVAYLQDDDQSIRITDNMGTVFFIHFPDTRLLLKLDEEMRELALRLMVGFYEAGWDDATEEDY